MAWKNDQVSEKETEKILELARSVLDIPGDFVEFGCYAGDTSLMFAEILDGAPEKASLGARRSLPSPRGSRAKPRAAALRTPCDRPFPGARLYLYDSFEGLPEKSAQDASEIGKDFKRGALAVSKREVKARFLRAGLPVPVIKKAWFSDLTEADLPAVIAFAFLDGDLYESIWESLRLVGPKMADGGVMVVHDYANPALPGVAKAVDEWLLTRKVRKTGAFETMIVIYV